MSPPTDIFGATPGEPVFLPSNSGQMTCLGSIDDADFILQDELFLKEEFTETPSLSYAVFAECPDGAQLTAVLFENRPVPT